MTDTFIWDKDTENKRMTDLRETEDILHEINEISCLVLGLVFPSGHDGHIYLGQRHRK